ncbi:endonuclease Q family protein [Pontibacillus litoralis]|uniref:TIGR00375 family protein n=1 Tax=Pontibacillus litoralis JSM 072002 TaxID=1385512 RepID=A0A0A5G1U4_9BACI|nr:endonuclease Q family protein [Pontibacillus litoralis]KGX85989.1 hypothetical protein N784_06355 [Pontibacillus litoralis JSM 072002]
MQTYYIDLHIHIGRTMYGAPVKITASDRLTLTNIMEEASERKGLDIIGIIDCQVPEVQAEIHHLIEREEAVELMQGGIRYKNTTLLLGAEIELYDDCCQGPLHVLCYLPTLAKMEQFTVWLSRHVTNITLSTQRFYGEATLLQHKVHTLGGLFVPAHIFTPFKSLYGKGVKQSLSEVLDPARIDAVELGLSADTVMANELEELQSYTFLSNSDAHSLPKIAREYQQMALQAPTFQEVKWALRQQYNRKVVANYGMNPLLGKYYQTTCRHCLQPMYATEVCSYCMSSDSVKGVAQRIEELTNHTHLSQSHHPPYIYQVPLEFIPKIGPKTLNALIQHVGTEMDVLHHASQATLEEVVSTTIAQCIIANRNGKLSIEAGGGGRYGRLNM